MFENVLWAKAAEKAVEGADKVSLASVEAVLKNLDRLATWGTWAIGIILGIALFVVGYNVWNSERTIKNLREEFQEKIAEFGRQSEKGLLKVVMLTYYEEARYQAIVEIDRGIYVGASRYLARCINFLVEALRLGPSERLEEILSLRADDLKKA